LKKKVKKIIKYLAAGSFLFFFIKGLIWLAVFAMAWLGYINYS